MGFFDWLFGGRRGSDDASAGQPAPFAPPVQRWTEPAHRHAQPSAPLRASGTAAAFAVVDVETTGLSPKRDRVLELAIVRVDARGVMVDRWSSRFNPEGPVGATHIHGIRDVDVARAPLFRQQAPEIVETLRGLPIVAHNARFDLSFLRAEFELAGWDMPTVPSYCTLAGSHHYHPALDRRRLPDCCAAAGVRHEDAHSALGDATATAALLQTYLRQTHRTDRGLAGLKGAQASWPSAPSRPHGMRLARASSASASNRFAARPVRPALLKRITKLSLKKLVADGAPSASLTYLEVLLEMLEDRALSLDEPRTLSDVASTYGLTPGDLRAAHEAFLLALASYAVSDGLVSRDERAELDEVATLLSLPSSTVKPTIDRALSEHRSRKSTGLRPLPRRWSHGEPLRVGDSVAFTGGEARQRESLEAASVDAGVRVVGSVSRLTTMLVADGGFAGNKSRDAAACGTRVVHPDTYAKLLQHIQPAASVFVAVADGTSISAREPVQSTRATASSARPLRPASEALPADIRAWALANGFEVGVRGRLPREVVEAYERAMTGR